MSGPACLTWTGQSVPLPFRHLARQASSPNMMNLPSCSISASQIRRAWRRPVRRAAKRVRSLSRACPGREFIQVGMAVTASASGPERPPRLPIVPGVFIREFGKAVRMAALLVEPVLLATAAEFPRPAGHAISGDMTSSLVPSSWTALAKGSRHRRGDGHGSSCLGFEMPGLAIVGSGWQVSGGAPDHRRGGPAHRVRAPSFELRMCSTGLNCRVASTEPRQSTRIRRSRTPPEQRGRKRNTRTQAEVWFPGHLRATVYFNPDTNNTTADMALPPGVTAQTRRVTQPSKRPWARRGSSTTA